MLTTKILKQVVIKTLEVTRKKKIQEKDKNDRFLAGNGKLKGSETESLGH